MANSAFKRCDYNPKNWMIDTTITFKNGEKFHLKRRGYPTKKAAIEDFYNQVDQVYKQLGYIRTKSKASDIIESFLIYKKARVRLSSFQAVKNLTSYLQGYFCKNDVKKIYTNYFLENIRNDISKLTYSRNYKNRIIALFNEISEFAYNNSMINEHHLKKVRLIMIPLPGFDIKPKHNIWTKEQYKKFIATFNDNDKYKVLFQWLFFSGCRIGEALALMWSDYDPQKQLIYINKTTSSRVGIGGPLITQTKTRAGTRYILLNDQMNEQMQKLSDSYNNGPNSFIFFGGDKPIGDSTVRRYFNIHAQNAGLPHITLHEIRHTNNTWLINSNPTPAGINIISSRLGRASLKTTLDDYYHTNPEEEQNLIENFEIE